MTEDFPVGSEPAPQPPPAPGTYGAVLEQYRGMPLDLVRTTVGLGQANGEDMALWLPEERPAGGLAGDDAKVAAPGQRIAAGPGVEHRLNAEQDTAARTPATDTQPMGGTRAEAQQSPKEVWAERLDSLWDTDGKPDQRNAHDTVDAIRKLYSAVGTDHAQNNALESVLAERPDAIPVLVASADQDTAGWDRLAVGIAVERAADTRSKYAERQAFMQSDPFAGRIEVDPVAAAADAEAAKQLLGLGGPYTPRDHYQAANLLRKYGQLEREGVSTATAQTYESITAREYSTEPPQAADVLKVTVAYEQASPEWQQFFTSNRYDIRRLSDISDYAASLSTIEPAEAKQSVLWHLASVTGCERSTDIDSARLVRQTVAELMERGAELRGVAGILSINEYMAPLQEAETAENTARHEMTLQLIASLSRHAKVFEQLEQKENALDDTRGVFSRRIISELAERPELYAGVVDAIERCLPAALASGYDAAIANQTALGAFSVYAGNSLYYYGGKGESLDDTYTRMTATDLEAMALLGDSSKNMAELFRVYHDPYLDGVTKNLLDGVAVNGKELRTGMHSLEAAITPLLEMPENHELFLQMAAAFGLRGMAAEIAPAIELAGLAGRPGQQLAENLVRTGHPWLVADNLPLFSNVSNEIAYSLLSNDTAARVLEHREAFPELNIDRQVFDRLVADGRAHVALDYAKLFTDVAPLDVAQAAIAQGLALRVFERLDEFPGIADMETDNELAIRFKQFIMDPELTSLLGAEGPLYSLAPQFLQLYMGSEHAAGVATQIKSLAASGDTALWRMNHEYAKLLVGEVGNVGYMTGYTVDAIPLALPNATVTYDETMPRPVPLHEMDADYRRMILTPEALHSYGDDLLAITEIKFTDLLPGYQDTVLGYRLYEAIGTSRDLQERQAASERNKRFAAEERYWQAGDLVHATREVANFRRILMNGMLCGETLGMVSGRDSYPYNVDTVEVSPRVLAADSHEDRLKALANQGYGPIALLFHRDVESTDFQREFPGGMNSDHRLVFGALAATEISAVLLREDSEILAADVADAIVESGMYIPVVNTKAETILSYEQFQERRAEGNYIAVQPRIVDSSFKRAGTQGGSNEGAMFVIPTTAGPEQYYVKFGDASSQKRDHLWNEILADKFYRTVAPALVPDTEAVIVEGRLARSSRVAPLAGAEVSNEARNAGFIMDAFLGNWDAVFNADNLVMSAGGHALRIDNGNALNFRARGERKAEGQFGPIVAEVEAGNDPKNLGIGMRQMYPDLSDEQVRRQVVELQERLPEPMIDALVDSVRLPAGERKQLIHTLKARRNDLISRYL